MNWNFPQNGDFLVDDQYTFEIGGRSKSSKQIAGLAQSYTAVADLETGTATKIPQWLFGMLN